MISIIIPVYNVEKFLDRCLESVTNQTYTDFECILVNDGSTDNSGNICDRWAKKDSRFKVIHQNNQGVSIARNMGLDNAMGEYIVFIDSDDWVEQSYLSDLIINSTSDIVISGTVVEKDDTCLSINSPLSDKTFEFNDTAIEDIKHLIKSTLIFGPYVKLYKSSIIKKHNIKFNTYYDYGEDLLFVFEYLKYVNTISTIINANYHYRQHSSNTLSKKYRHNFFDINYFQYAVVRDLLLHKNVYKSAVKDIMNTRLYGVIYDSIFQYQYINFTDFYQHNKKILSILELNDSSIKNAKFPISKWLRFLISKRLPLILTIILYIKR